MKDWGIDISRWQKGLRLDLFNNCKFVIIKAGGSDGGELYIDSQFLDFYTQAKLAGLPVGIYWYTQAVSVTNLIKEIDYLLGNIKGLQFELPIFLDLEESVLYDQAAKLAVYWINTLPEKGYYPGIYSSYSWWYDSLKNVSCDPVQKWVALWGGYDSPGINCGIWQDGLITTQDIQVDSDYIFADYSFIKEKGLNGFMNGIKYSDISADRNTYKAINAVTEAGLMKGFNDGTFRPEEPVTREQLAVVLERLLKND